MECLGTLKRSSGQLQLRGPRYFLALHLVLAASWAAGPVLAQCPAGWTAIIADRDNTLYENASGTLSNGSGDYFFAGRTGQSSDRLRRGLVHFDVAGSLSPGQTIAEVELHLVVDQPQNHGVRSVGLHAVDADWGEAGSFGDVGEGMGGTAVVGDATWIDTFRGTSTWTSPGGDFDAVSSATADVDSGVDGDNVWSSAGMVADVQSWLDAPATNYGWLVRGEEASGTTAIRFATREVTGSEPTLCILPCGGGVCEIFSDGFESGDLSNWSASVP